MRSNAVGRSRRRVGRDGRIALGVIAAAIGGLLSSPAASWAQPAWSSAISVVRCASVAAPRVVFPAADPFHSGGPGAILWSGEEADCAPASTPAGPGLGIAAFGSGDALGPARSLPVAGGPRLSSLSAVTATGNGRIVIAGGLGTSPSSTGGVSEGPADGSFTRAAGLGGPSTPVAVTSSYRGDIALASVSAGGKVELRVEQHAAPAISPPVVITSRSAKVTAIAVNVDYRGDAIVAWAESGAIFARERESSGKVDSTRWIAPSPAAPRLQALISDDGRAIVAWENDVTATDGGGGTAGTTTAAYLDVSEPGILFTAPHLLERFADPPGLAPPASGLQLVRLAYEGVVVVWTGLSGAHFVVRAAPVSTSSIRPTTTVSDPNEDAMLADVATGPRNELMALWTSAPRSAGERGQAQQEILSARGTSAPSGVASFDSPQLVASAGPISTPTIAIDPVSDLAVAVWRRLGGSPGIDYAVRGLGSSDRSIPGGRTAPRASRPVTSGDESAGTVAVVALVALLGFGVILVGARGRARAREERRARIRRRPGPAGRTGWLRTRSRGQAGADS